MNELVDDLLAPELSDLTAVVGSVAARALARMPGSWRRASHHELSRLGLSKGSLAAVEAVQRLVRQGFPSLPICRLVRSDDVGLVYCRGAGEGQVGGVAGGVVGGVARQGVGEAASSNPAWPIYQPAGQAR